MASKTTPMKRRVSFADEINEPPKSTDTCQKQEIKDVERSALMKKDTSGKPGHVHNNKVSNGINSSCIEVKHDDGKLKRHIPHEKDLVPQHIHRQATTTSGEVKRSSSKAKLKGGQHSINNHTDDEDEDKKDKEIADRTNKDEEAKKARQVAARRVAEQAHLKQTQLSQCKDSAPRHVPIVVRFQVLLTFAVCSESHLCCFNYIISDNCGYHFVNIVLSHHHRKTMCLAFCVHVFNHT
jgi:hypothetical protein